MANLNKLKEVRTAILNYPENFNYKTVSSLKDNNIKYGPIDQLFEHGCNTCGCVAGFTCSLVGIIPKYQSIYEARKVLELDPYESGFLFFAFDDSELDSANYLSNYNYPKNFYYDRSSNEEGLIEALRRLDFMIEHYSKEQTNDN